MKKNLQQLLMANNLIEKGSSNLIKMLLDYNAKETDYKIHKNLLRELIVKVSKQSNKLEENLKEIEEKNKKLKELDKLKNEFLGMASHDLRNPISAIEMISDLLLESVNNNLTEEQIEFLKEIKSSSEHMSILLNDLLDITAIESGNLKLEFTKENYFEFIKNIIKFNKGFGDKKSITFELNYYSHTEELVFDKNKITQVINNLISNGIKYSYADTKIIIEIKRENEYILTEVIDQGQGIPENELKNIFKEFHKSSVKSTDGEKSTGLGLAIAKKIIEGHGGEIGVKSQVGKGSTFYYTLPVMRDA